MNYDELQKKTLIAPIIQVLQTVAKGPHAQAARKLKSELEQKFIQADITKEQCDSYIENATNQANLIAQMYQLSIQLKSNQKTLVKTLKPRKTSKAIKKRTANQADASLVRLFGQLSIIEQSSPSEDEQDEVGDLLNQMNSLSISDKRTRVHKWKCPQCNKTFASKRHAKCGAPLLSI